MTYFSKLIYHLKTTTQNTIRDLTFIRLRIIAIFTIIFSFLAVFMVFYLEYAFENHFEKMAISKGNMTASLLTEEIEEHKLYDSSNEQFIKDNDKLFNLLNFHKRALKLLNYVLYDKTGKIVYTSLKNEMLNKTNNKRVKEIFSSHKVLLRFIKEEDIKSNSDFPRSTKIIEVNIPTKLGVFAIYQDFTHYSHDYKHIRNLLITTILSSLGLSYLILLLLFRQIRRREQELIHQKELAEEANILKDNFLAKLSHEIKNPLNAVFGFSQLIKMRILEDENEDSSKCLQYCLEDNDAIIEGAKAIKRFVDDLLNFEQMKSGRLKIIKGKVNLKEIVKSLNHFAKINIKNKDISFGIDFDSNIDFIITDKIRLDQILQNLLSNAIKFTLSGSINVNISKVNSNLQIAIQDTGIGIPSNELDKIFNDFYQTKYKPGGYYEGLGLGLAIVKHFVHLLGGDIKVESKKSLGTLFTLTLP